MSPEITFEAVSPQKPVPVVSRSIGSIQPRLARKCRFHARAEHGSAIVETAFAMIILLAVLFGVLEICMALYTYHFISAAAREGTRYAIVRGSACQAPGNPCPATQTDIQNYVSTLGFPGINIASTDVSVSWAAYPAGGTCSPSASCNNPGNMVKVTVSHAFPLSIPFVPSSNIPMTSTSAMIISQ